MSIKLIQIEPHNLDKDNLLHLVNFESDSDEKNVLVDKYFNSQIKFQNDSLEYWANIPVSFRGRPLNGTKTQLSHDYSFALASKNGVNIEARRLNNEVHYWNLDKKPSKADSIPQIKEWLDLSSAIHSHVQLED
ncbi:secreted protein [Sarcoptes scabiei]|uniref:Uncharacterized protein n=1 Tax=Sarcoptes scabiei TaxID=52283 RepID=A0A132AGB1_SARSC|nr:hypothetical protein QR98_0085190 [Sarcoptes scabiei]UXI21180.1 secreted protein [Sarcoptes scabiei]